jgi:hypothetical protein
MEDNNSDISEIEFHESDYVKFKLAFISIRRRKLKLLQQIREEKDEVRSLLLVECLKALRKEILA